VQDLPPAIPYLISKFFNDGLYYSGDSAQVIQKGITFKFSDIYQMFHESFDAPLLNFEKPTKYELTVNFRSHSKIL